MKNKVCLTLALITCIAITHGQKKVLPSKRKYEIPYINGAFQHIFNPNESRSQEDTTWYTNDHCFVKDNAGTWHAYGIIGHKPIDPWKGENRFFQITAKSITQRKWVDNGDAMKVQEGIERVLWAPHIVKDRKTYYVFYNTGNMQKDAPATPSWGQLRMAKSTDLKNWERFELNPLFSDPGHARDSFVMKYKNKYYYYYTRLYNEVDQRSVIALRTGPDLFHWSGPKIVHLQPQKVNWGEDAESPFIIFRKGIFYLFVCRARTKYNQTDVYWSEDPENFPRTQFACTLPLHAAEVIYDRQEGYFISNTGWDKKGVYLASLSWKTIR